MSGSAEIWILSQTRGLTEYGIDPSVDAQSAINFNHVTSVAINTSALASEMLAIFGTTDPQALDMLTTCDWLSGDDGVRAVADRSLVTLARRRTHSPPAAK